MGRCLAGEVSAGLHSPCNQGYDLGRNVKQRIGKALLRYEPNPLKHAEPLKQSELGSYRFRVGDYRVVFDLEGDQIVVLRVGHRKEIYKR